MAGAEFGEEIRHRPGGEQEMVDGGPRLESPEERGEALAVDVVVAGAVQQK